MREPYMIIKSKDNRRKGYSFYEDIDLIKKEMGDNAVSESMDNIGFYVPMGNYTLKEIQRAVENIKALKEITDKDEFQRLRSIINFKHLAYLDLQESKYFTKDTDPKTVFEDFIEVIYAAEVGEYALTEIEIVLDKYMNYKAFKDKVISSRIDKVVHTKDNRYLILNIDKSIDPDVYEDVY